MALLKAVCATDGRDFSRKPAERRFLQRNQQKAPNTEGLKASTRRLFLNSGTPEEFKPMI